MAIFLILVKLVKLLPQETWQEKTRGKDLEVEVSESNLEAFVEFTESKDSSGMVRMTRCRSVGW